MQCRHNDAALSRIIPKPPGEALPPSSQYTFRLHGSRHRAALSQEVGHESTEDVRARYLTIKINDVRFSAGIFKHVGNNGTVVSYLVQELPSLSHYVRLSLLGQRLNSIVDVGAGEKDSTNELFSGPADEGRPACQIENVTPRSAAVFNKSVSTRFAGCRWALEVFRYRMDLARMFGTTLLEVQRL